MRKCQWCRVKPTKSDGMFCDESRYCSIACLRTRIFEHGVRMNIMTWAIDAFRTRREIWLSKYPEDAE